MTGWLRLRSLLSSALSGVLLGGEVASGALSRTEYDVQRTPARMAWRCKAALRQQPVHTKCYSSCPGQGFAIRRTIQKPSTITIYSDAEIQPCRATKITKMCCITIHIHGRVATTPFF